MTSPTYTLARLLTLTFHNIVCKLEGHDVNGRPAS